MSTRAERQQKLFRYYKEQTGKKEVSMRDLAEFAHKMGYPLPKPIDPMEMLAKQFAESIGEEVRRDKVTKREYKANLAFTMRLSNGKQGTLWVEVDEAPRHRMVKGLHLYREQMVGEAVVGHNTAEHWNRVNPDQEPLPFDPDLTDDVKWRLNAMPKTVAG